jgi:hypothetical protein
MILLPILTPSPSFTNCEREKKIKSMSNTQFYINKDIYSAIEKKKAQR